MEKDKFIEEIRNIESLQAKYSRKNGELASLFGCDSTAENGFLPLFYKMRDTAIKHLSNLAGDNGEWCLWFFDEVTNHENKMECTPKKGVDKIMCKNAYDLWDIIQAAQ